MRAGGRRAGGRVDTVTILGLEGSGGDQIRTFSSFLGQILNHLSVLWRVPAITCKAAPPTTFSTCAVPIMSLTSHYTHT